MAQQAKHGARKSPRRTSEPKPVKQKTVKEEKTPKQKKGTHKAGWIVLVCVMVILALGIGVGGYYVNDIIGGLKTTNLTTDKKKLGISEDVKTDDKIVNIALLGVDSRTTDVEGRSDTIIILSVDKRHGKLKMTSILRDSEVIIDRGTWKMDDKITHAFAYGGAEMSIKTLNQNFNLDIQEYVAVNFYSLAKVIDELGGLDIEISRAEKNEINRIIKLPTSNYSKLGLDKTLITETGLVHMNGTQALTYARIRKIDSDNARSGRQQVVIDKLFEKARKIKSVGEYTNLAKTLLPMVETSLSLGDIIELCPIMLEKDLSLERLTIPDNSIPELKLTDGYNSRGGWVWKFDLNAAAKAIHSFIYEDDQ